MKRAVLACLLAALLSGCGISLAGDVTPGPNALISGQNTPQPVQHPAAPPDLAAGAQQYNLRCLACHGPGGLGDGEQAAQLPFPPSAIGSAGTARGASPAEWFQMISEGRITRYMPPFAGTLSLQERWDVLAYVYSLGLSPELLARGEEVYAAQRAGVEGLLGGNDFLAETSLFSALDLSIEDNRALVGFLQARALSLDGRPAPLLPSAPAAPPAAAETLGRVSGRVQYGSPGPLPGGLQVTLTGFDHTQPVVSVSGDVSADGSFVFEDVPMLPGRVFFVEVGYQGLRYFSEFAAADAAANELDLPVFIFDTTDDPGQLVVESVQLVYNFSRTGIVQVIQRVSLTNLGDKAVAPGADGLPLLQYRLPPGATELAFSDGALGERYVAGEDGFGDLRAVMPGQNSYQILFAYQLPYRNSLTYQIYIDRPTRALVALLPEGSLSMRSADFALAGTQELEGIDYAVYTAAGPFSAGDVLNVDIRGGHPQGGLSSLLRVLSRDDSLLAGLAGMTLAVGLLWWWLRSNGASRQAILDEIVALDDRYVAGELAEPAYQRRRAALKARLAAALKRGSRS